MLKIPCPKCEMRNALYTEEDKIAGRCMKCLYCGWMRYLESKITRKEIFNDSGKILRRPNIKKARVFL